jgi:hypothetical protein
MTASVEGGSAEMVDWKAPSSGISCTVVMVLVVYERRFTVEFVKAVSEGN